MKLNRDDIDKFFDYDIHIPTRTIFMGGEVDEGMAERLIKGITLLKTSDQPITILMNSIGGDEYHGLAIYDAIATSPQHITIVALGHAMSMGSWVLQAADERVIAPNATLMMHYGAWGYGEDHVKYMRSSNKEMERLVVMMEKVYLDRIKEVDPKFPLRKLKKMLEDEVYLTAEESVAIGLADKVLQ